MMRELSFRNRAEEEARAILRRKDRRNRKELARTAETMLDSQQRPVRGSGVKFTPEDTQLDDNWFEGVDAESDSDYEGQRKDRTVRPPSRLEIVIEDSDWDDAELVE